ncbi:hypothetical protein DRE_06952 [Drechslerella stenobrocha 248]|uniref:Chromosome segregation in meiosis protein n=1 Tax=Drechslerella stenobrocha 248 TaxID=1043628 RepID=W7HVX4_9PEZI|nr:hypothetical protein DRE_06952 [Drechslerella stenobrocha 248]
MSGFDTDNEIDDLFSYDIDEIDTTFDAGVGAQSATDTTGATAKAKGGADDGDLGVDAEIKIRKRKPAVKLTEERLLGPDGIPYLQQHAPKRIKFKGKGHEVSDLGRLLNFYQIWADNMYPKANFKDALAMIEKLGSSRGMRRRREELIEEFKMKQREEDDRLVGRARDLVSMDTRDPDPPGRKTITVTDPMKKESENENTTTGDIGGEKPGTDVGDSLFFHDSDDELDDDLDELDAIMRDAENAKQNASNEPDAGEMDELDAIMREMEAATDPTGKPASTQSQNVATDDEFEEAMASIRENEK